MDVRDYCDSLLTELTGWKAKMYDVMRKLEKVPSGEKENLLPYLNDFNIIFEELDNRIGKLRSVSMEMRHLISEIRLEQHRFLVC